MNKLYQIDLTGIGTITADRETLDCIRRLLVDAASYSSELVDYCHNNEYLKSNAEMFQSEFNERMNNAALLQQILVEEIY